MDDILKIFKDKKIRATAQRLGVYQALAGRGGHLTAEEIFEKIKKQFPGFSLATVYTALDELKEKDLVSEVRIKPDRACFEAKKELHHHLLCKKCGKIWDIFIKPCDPMKKKKVCGHLIEDLHGYFYGVCKKCRRSGNKTC